MNLTAIHSHAAQQIWIIDVRSKSQPSHHLDIGHYASADVANNVGKYVVNVLLPQLGLSKSVDVYVQTASFIKGDGAGCVLNSAEDGNSRTYGVKKLDAKEYKRLNTVELRALKQYFTDLSDTQKKTSQLFYYSLTGRTSNGQELCLGHYQAKKTAKIARTILKNVDTSSDFTIHSTEGTVSQLPSGDWVLDGQEEVVCSTVTAEEASRIIQIWMAHTSSIAIL